MEPMTEVKRNRNHMAYNEYDVSSTHAQLKGTLLPVYRFKYNTAQMPKPADDMEDDQLSHSFSSGTPSPKAARRHVSGIVGSPAGPSKFASIKESVGPLRKDNTTFNTDR